MDGEEDHVSFMKLPPMDDKAFEKACLFLLSKCLSGWNKKCASKARFRRIGGGITNEMVEVMHEKCVPQRIVVRRFGTEEVEGIVDRKEERQALPQISRSGFGAELLCTFSNGRIESYLEGRSLETMEMYDPKLKLEIARCLHRFHLLDIHTDRGREPITFSKLREWWMRLHSKKPSLPESKEESYLDKDQTNGNGTSDGSVLPPRSKSWDDLERWKEEIDFLEQQAKGLGMIKKEHVVYCHHDLLSGNIMKMNDGKVQFIDFEYGGYGYRGFDIANHFNEYAGFECNYLLYPDKEQRYVFYEAYVEDGTEADMDSLEREVTFFRLVSHVWWGIWAKLQACDSTIDFDFDGYAKKRWEAYFAQRDDSISIVKSEGSRKFSLGHCMCLLS